MNEGKTLALPHNAPDSFDHKAHVKAGFDLLHRQPFLQAADHYCEALKDFTAKVGQPEKFNMTLTLAFLSIIAERIGSNRDADWDAFIKHNNDLLDPKLLRRWYSRDRLWSEHARTHFTLP